MSIASPEPSLDTLSLSGSTVAPTISTTDVSNNKSFVFPTYASFPPFYTLQPNLTTRARQIELWTSLVTAYCTHHRLFKLSLSSPPLDLFANNSLKRNLKPSDIKLVLDSMLTTGHIEWLSSREQNVCWVFWKSLSDWADAIYAWVEETGQKGAVLTIYELREGEGVESKEWRDIDEGFLRKILAVLVKRGRAQIFGQEENAGVKFF